MALRYKICKIINFGNREQGTGNRFWMFSLLISTYDYLKKKINLDCVILNVVLPCSLFPVPRSLNNKIIILAN
jgi:hypothetical protein